MGVDCFAATFPAPIGPDGQVIEWPNPAARAELADRIVHLPDPILDACFRVVTGEESLGQSGWTSTIRAYLNDAIDTVVVQRPYTQIAVTLGKVVWYMFVDNDAGGIEDLDPMTAVAVSGVTVLPLQLDGRQRAGRRKPPIGHVRKDAMNAAVALARCGLEDALRECPPLGHAEHDHILALFDDRAGSWSGSVDAAQMRIRASWSNAGYLAFAESAPDQ